MLQADVTLSQKACFEFSQHLVAQLLVIITDCGNVDPILKGNQQSSRNWLSIFCSNFPYFLYLHSRMR